MVNILTIDVEEYFHPSEVQRHVPAENWESLPSRVEAQTDRVLDLLARHNASATFFVMGWVAERHPAMTRRIVEAGHEIGCHSFAHQLVYDMTPAQFRADTERAVRVIEDVAGAAPRLYRAPSYSITGRSLWALEILAECGFTYDSSIYPIAHDRYGIPGFERQAQTIHTASGPILEVPIATAKLGAGGVVPVGGGAYLRLLPYRFTAAGIRRINREERRPACIYFHPWEIDPRQPRLAAGLVARMRTYAGLGGMERKLAKLLTDFRFLPITAVYPHARDLRVTTPEAGETEHRTAFPVRGLGQEP
jgi:polysaccharide deacetylase family protein (PEP-CTERM system associated)